MTRTELLNWLRQEYGQWETLLDEIGPAHMDQPGVNGDWSMKDVVAHLTGWNHWLVIRLQAVQRGEAEPAPPWPSTLQSEDEINAWIYESHRDSSVHEVLDETRQVHRQLITTLEGLTDNVRIERIEPTFYLVWLGDERFVASEFFNHFHDDHEPDVRSWLAQVKKQ